MPKSKRTEFIVLVHICLTGTHRSEKETSERIKEEYFGQGCLETLKYFVGLVTCVHVGHQDEMCITR